MNQQQGQEQQQQQQQQQESTVLTDHFLPTANELEREQRLIDQGLVCPVTQNAFEDPVRASDGHLYERRFIEEWIATCRAGGRRVTSPLTRAELTDVLTPAPEVRAAVVAMLQRPGALLPEHTGIKFEPPFFKQLDKFLETQLVRSLNLRPPAIVPLGVESAGKSTVLERIMGLTLLPRDEQMCTRMVIRVHLRRRREAARAAVRLVIRSRAAPFAEDASTERHVAALDFIAENVKEMMDAAVAQAQQAIVMDRELLVEVFRPDAPNLDIIDVPGLVTAERPGLENAPALTAQLVEDVITTERGHGIFLIVLPATEQANTSVTMRLVQKHNLQGTSLGIRTKLDLKYPQNADDTRAEVVTMEVLGSVPDPMSTTGGRLRAPGFVDLALGWLGMANISGRRALEKVVSHHRERYRLVQMDEAEVKLWAQLQATDDTNVLPLLEGRFGRRAAVHYVQKQFERFIVDRWLPTVRDVLQRHYFDVSAEYLARGAPVPVERAADEARAPADGEAMRAAVARVAADVEQFIPGDAESVFAVRAAFAATPEEMKRVFDQRLEATAAVSVENDWTGVMGLAPVWQAVAEVEAAVRLVEEMGSQPVAPAHATRLISGNKSRLRQATDRAVEALCSFAATGLVDRFVDAFDAAPSRSVELPAGGALPVRKLTAQLRLRERLPEVAEALKQHALSAVRLAAEGEFRTSAAALIDREIDDAYIAARASTSAGAAARGEFVVRTIQAERTKLLGARVVDLFVAVVIGGLAASLRQWAVRPELLIETTALRALRRSDLARLVDAGDALHSLKALQDSIDPRLGQAAAPPARNTWAQHLVPFLRELPESAS